MPSKRIDVAVLLAMILTAGCALETSRGQDAKNKRNARGGMMTNGAPGLVLTASLRAAVPPIIAEQAVDFDLQIRNDGAAAVTIQSLNNDLTPSLRLLDATGRVLGEYSPGDRSERVLGDMGTVTPSSPDMVDLAPGGAGATWVNTWAYRDPLAPGKYSFEAVHYLQSGGPVLTSNRVPFEIVAAHVEALAMGHNSAARASTVMAWLAMAEGSRNARLLIRQSGFTGHHVAQIGGTPHGEFPPGSRVAVAAMPVDARFPSLGWAAVVSGSTLQLIQHNMSTPYWRPEAVTLPVNDAVPVPRFPNRAHAVFLASGKGGAGPVLTGLVMTQGSPAPKPWTVRLTVEPLFSACAFTMQGPIAVLFASDDGQTARLHRIDVNEDGTVASPERELGETRNEVLGMVTDMRAGQPAAFVVLEADRQQHDHLAWVKIPLGGQLARTALQPTAGWPMTRGPEPKPEKPTQMTLEIGPDGMPWLAMVDAEGDLIGGRGNSSLTVYREGKKRRCLFPQIGSVARGATISCFNPDGTLFHSGSGSQGH